MDLEPLTPVDLAWSVLPVLVLVALIAAGRLGLSRALVIATIRLCLQLTIIGYVLKALFATSSPWLLALIALVMVLVGGHEIVARQKHRFRGWRGLGLGTAVLFLSSFAVTLYGLNVVVRPDPWFSPQYTIPLLGMLVGNTMTAISLSVDRLTTAVHSQREIVEQRLLLGEPASTAIDAFRRDAFRGGFTPVVNSMATAGIVSLPGMMTGQILAGSPPTEAVRYQIMIWLLIAAGTGLGMLLALHLASRALFDPRQRLRLDRLR